MTSIAKNSRGSRCGTAEKLGASLGFRSRMNQFYRLRRDP